MLAPPVVLLLVPVDDVPVEVDAALDWPLEVEPLVPLVATEPTPPSDAP